LPLPPEVAAQIASGVITSSAISSAGAYRLKSKLRTAQP
jgi:hypothetical protein